MSLGAMGKMFGLGALGPKRAARQGLEGATSGRYRAENPDEFERLVDKRLADSPSLASYYAQAKAGSRFDGSGKAGQIGASTLVIHSSEDRYVPPSNARALAKRPYRTRSCASSKEQGTWCSSSGPPR
jgi:pimeloyl-ACP methyl ester carboxylesterase